VHESHDKVREDHGIWNELLRDRFVLAYEDDHGHWYDRNHCENRSIRSESPRTVRRPVVCGGIGHRVVRLSSRGGGPGQLSKQSRCAGEADLLNVLSVPM
jgi:hypothetical protein